METQNNKGTIIPHVLGNVLELTIPLELTKASVVNGMPKKVKVPFLPTKPVNVILTCGNHSVKKVAEMQNNLANVEFSDELKLGVYAVTVMTKTDDNKPMRFKQKTVVEVFDTTREAGIEPGVEFDSERWILDAAVFFGGISVFPEESDPAFSESPAATITAEDIDRWNAGGSGGSGYQVSYSNGVLSFTGDTQPTYNNGILTL